MRILIFGNGTLSVGHQEIKLCIEIVKQGHTVYLVINEKPKLFDVGVIEEFPKDLHLINVSAQEVTIPSDIDACLGMDQSVVLDVHNFKKKFPHIFCACIFLDYPRHVISDQMSVSYNFEYKKRYFYWLDIAKNLDKIIFLNKFTVDLVKKEHNINSSFVLYPCTAPTNIIKQEQDYVISCHRLIKCKGTDILISALSRTNYIWKHIYVSGEEEETIKNQAKSSMLNKYSLHKRCGEKEKMIIMANAKVLVSSVNVPYVPCLSVIEAFAVKTPCIVPDFDVSYEMYGDNVLYFKNRNTRDLREKIVMLMENKDLRKDIAKKGHNRYLECYMPNKAAQKLIYILGKS